MNICYVVFLCFPLLVPGFNSENVLINESLHKDFLRFREAGNFVFLPAKEFEMKNIIIPIFLLFMAFACQPRLSMQPLLEKADSLLVSNPDSVFLMLDAVPNPEDFPENEYADWCLLLTQARDMTGRTHTSDSLICLATNYYRE